MTTYLSRVALNPQRRAGRSLLGSPQVMHAAVLACFPGRLTDRTDRRVLWRLDDVPGAVHLYVVSPEEPDFTHVVEQAGWPQRPSWETREYGPFLDRIESGSSWGYRLTANPTRSVGTGDGGRGRRVGHVTVAQQQEWLTTRAPGAGFHVPGSGPAVVHRDVARFRRGSAQVTLARATFEGVLQVTDPVTLRAALVEGIGSGKAYGCGLLTLAPPP